MKFPYCYSGYYVIFVKYYFCTIDLHYADWILFGTMYIKYGHLHKHNTTMLQWYPCVYYPWILTCILIFRNVFAVKRHISVYHRIARKDHYSQRRRWRGMWIDRRKFSLQRARRLQTAFPVFCVLLTSILHKTRNSQGISPQTVTRCYWVVYPEFY